MRDRAVRGFVLSLVLLSALGVGARGAHADALAPQPIPDATWAAVKDRIVTLQANQGELRGTAIAFDAQTVTLVEAGTNRVVSLARADITAVFLLPVAPPPVAAPQPPLAVEAPAGPPPKKRYVGLQVATGPGNLVLDLEYGHFYGFVGTSIGYPILFTRSSEEGQYFAVILGAGGTWRMSPKSNWHFDLTANFIPTYWGGFSAGLGVSAGFHYTSATGFTVGFKIPIFGVAPGCSRIFRDGDNYDYGSNECTSITKGGSLVGNYYLQAGMSLPIASIGYRF